VGIVASTVSHFITYALHYVILRTLYTSARSMGVNPWVMVGGAVAGLILIRIIFGKAFGRGGSKRYERRQERPGRAYRVERARQEARRDAQSSEHTRGRWRL
jgi:hypothetical protein